MFRNPQVEAYDLRPQTIKHVEILNVSDKPTYDTSLERFLLGYHRFKLTP